MNFEIRREIALPAGPDEVWRAIATPEGQAGWFMTVEDVPEDAAAEVVEDPPRRLEQRFGTQAIEYVVEAASGGSTVLRFVHSGIREEDWGDEWETMTGLGWDLYLFTLAEYLRHFPGRPAVYAETEAPPDPDVWPGVLAALGDPHVGDRVETPVGPGVVDIRTGTHLGIRTDTALVRFHERSLIGMGTAVGHHETGSTDRESLVATWSRWLDGVAER
ncbi:SRPBCC domain-containing protein [Pseudonocardia sp. ICBG1293]|uniref:SRPBCC family protein n=1 Tax=Pseudonocardia sp. ICBG1293 TaxID=2844382 RepID=UPI001CCBA300|nr:SRPBCC domain-containing protein [Pseudonocardia sp. ICBG1293]